MNKPINLAAQAVPFQPESPVPLMRETPGAEPYPLENLGPLAPVVRAIQRLTEAPDALAAQSVLATAALAVQGQADVETLAGQVPVSLYLVTVAGSGERKSACDKLAMRGVRQFEADLRADHETDLATWKNRHAIWEAQHKAALAKVAKNPDGARVDLEKLGPEPPPPLLPHIVASDPTLEGIARNMPQLRASLGLLTDEGGGFVGGHAMAAETKLRTLAGLARLWGGDPLDRWRAGDGVASFPGRRFSMHIMLQPVAAEGLLGDPMASGQGFLARCLIAEPESTVGTRLRMTRDPADESDVDRFAARIRDLLARPLPLRDGARNELAPPVLALTREARAVLIEFARDVERAQAPGGAMDGARAFGSKAAEHATRLAAVLTLIENPGADRIGAEAMANGAALAAFYAREALRLTDGATISPETANAERLRIWLRDRWGEPFISAPDVARLGPKALRETKKAKHALETLVQHRYLGPVEGGAEVSGKHRREAYRVVRGDFS